MKVTWGSIRSAAFCISMAASAWGQTTGSGTIDGTVRDANQAVVPGASVTVHNVGTGVDRNVQTNEVGLYSVPFLAPGNCELNADKAGFAKLVRKDLVLSVGQILTAPTQPPRIMGNCTV